MQRKVLVLCVLLAVALPSSVPAKRPMTPEDLYTVKRVEDPQVSPDGRWVAFTIGEPKLAEDRISTDIWLMPISGGEPRRLSFGGGDNHSPRWSPDGNRLLFLSDRSGADNLYLLRLDGAEARQLTSSEQDLAQPIWSADGRSVLVTSRVLPQGKKQLESWTAEELPKCRARTIDRLLFRQWNRWLGDERNHLFLVSVADGRMTELTPGDYDTPPVSLAGSHEFDIAPDGSEVCFVRNDDPDSALSTNHDLFLLDPKSGAIRRLTVNPALDASPHYSPDGRFLAYVAMSTPGYESDRKVLTLLDRASGEQRPLSGSLDRSVDNMLWLPDSSGLLFTARDAGRSNIFMVNLEGELSRLVEGGYSTEMSISPDGSRLIFVRSYCDQPAELWVHRFDEGITTQLSELNREWLTEIDLPRLEEISFSGADGVEVHGFLQKPPGFDARQRYPVVLAIHGGPQGMWADRFLTTWFSIPLLSSPGYVAVMINPRGSSGYGQEFRSQVSKDYGGRVIADLLAGLDHVIAGSPNIDARRQAVVGGSFGGYAVNWLIGSTERFSCAVSHAGLYNLTSFYGATEELWFPAWDMGLTPWDEARLYARWSPHTQAASFFTPTLVTHGELDYRVPFAESLQLFTALKVQGVPARLVVFPDDGHVITNPQSNVRWWKEIHRWLAEYLKPEPDSGS